MSGGRQSGTINLEKNILFKNDSIAGNNRSFFNDNKVFALNILSSPGSGKSTMIACTIKHMKAFADVFYIGGDQLSESDLETIKQHDVPFVRVNSGDGCHLDASMITDACEKMDVKANSLVLIENVGNLVCPAMFDLGEQKRAVMVSVTEGEEKPLKHPKIFSTADICILGKTDLIPLIGFDADKFRNNLMKVNKNAKLVTFSRKHENEDWFNWLKNNLKK